MNGCILGALTGDLVLHNAVVSVHFICSPSSVTARAIPPVGSGQDTSKVRQRDLGSCLNSARLVKLLYSLCLFSLASFDSCVCQGRTFSTAKKIAHVRRWKSSL